MNSSFNDGGGAAVPFRSMNMSRARVPMTHQLLFQQRSSPGKDSPSSTRIRPRLRSSNRIPTFVPKGSPLVNDRKEKEEASETQQSSSDSPLFSKRPSWIWKLEAAPPVAPFPLERTAKVLKGLTLSTIAARISAFMKEYSMSCVYRTKEARVDCSTCCGLKFVVQLWRKTGEEGTPPSTDIDDQNRNDSQPSLIVLEVQRRKGCCIVMRTIRRLLYAAVLKHSHANDVTTSSSSSVSNRFLELKRRSVGSDCMEKAAASSALDSITSTSGCQVKPRCLELLAGERIDCVRLGMETLLVLVTPELAGIDSAEEVAQALLFGKGELVHALHPAFLSLYRITNDITVGNEDDDAVSVVSSLECTSTTVTDYERQKLRLLLLKVLSSALVIVDEKEQDYLCNEATVMLDLTSDFWKQTLSYLLVRLEECDKGQHEATLAAKCFRILEALQPNVLIPLTESAIVGRASNAYIFGKRHHLQLERESEKLLRSLHLFKSLS